jgi:hypothetical protein
MSVWKRPELRGNLIAHGTETCLVTRANRARQERTMPRVCRKQPEANHAAVAAAAAV